MWSRPYSNHGGHLSINFISFKTTTGRTYSGGGETSASHDVETFEFTTLFPFVGSYGKFDTEIHSIGFITALGGCNCQNAMLVPKSVPSLAASVSSGEPTIYTVPEFENTYTLFAMGGCGSQTMFIKRADGGSLSFLNMNKDTNVLTLQSDRRALAGSYEIDLVVRLDDYPEVSIETSFIVYLFIFEPKFYEPNVQAVLGKALFVRPAFVLEPAFDFDTTIERDKDADDLPEFASYNKLTNLLLVYPVSQEEKDSNFKSEFICSIPELDGMIAPVTAMYRFRVVTEKDFTGNEEGTGDFNGWEPTGPDSGTGGGGGDSGNNGGSNTGNNGGGGNVHVDGHNTGSGG